jgi:hypothetical protein
VTINKTGLQLPQMFWETKYHGASKIFGNQICGLMRGE